MKNNTIVTASDVNYAWGVWLLIASIRKAGMDEPILVGAYNWPRQWKDDILKFDGVELSELPLADKRCVTCSKPEIALRARTEYVTWLDCDGILTGNCGDVLVSRPGEICIRPRTGSEIEASFRRQRRPGEEPGDIPAAVLDIWRRDVGEREEPRRKRGCSTGVFTVHRSAFPFLQKWIDQMKKVLPSDVKIVADGSVAYFQTDDAVLNSLLLFANDAPEVSAEYHADDTGRAHFVHFGFNPKPWVMWNPQSIRFFDKTMEIIDWALANGYAPAAKLPFPYRKEHRRSCRLAAPLARVYYKWMKIRRKLKGMF